MQIRKGAVSILHNVLNKLWGVGLITAAFILIGVGNQTTAYGFGGGWGLVDHSEDDIGSTGRNNIIFFENEKVEAGVPLTVAGAPEDSSYQWTILSASGAVNSFITTDNYYIPTKTDKETLITVAVDGMEDSHAAIYYSELPVVYLNNVTGYYAVGEEYSDAVISMQGNAAYHNVDQFYNGDIRIKLRGNSTKWREKRPFNIKLETKADLFGMGKSKHWALLANDIDHTLMRNKLLYDFSGAIGMDTYIKSENVVVIFNNQYYGVYQLCELVNIESERVDIYNWEESAEDAADRIIDDLVKAGKLSERDADTAKNNLEDVLCQDLSWITEPYTFSYDVDLNGASETYTITDYLELPVATGGILLEMDFFAFDNTNTSTMITEYSQPIYVKTPEYAITNKVLFDYTEKYIQTFEYALHSTDFIYHEKEQKFQAWSRFGGNTDLGYKQEIEFTAPEYDGKHYTELFDFDSLVQNFLVCELSMNWDSMKNSVFFYKDIDGLFYVGPEWDFDWAWGNINMYNINTWYPTSWHTTEDDFTVEQFYQTVQWNRYLIRDPYFLVKVYEKYKEIRGTMIEDMIKAGGTIEALEEYLKDAAEANDAKWNYSYGQYRSENFGGSMENMREFINTRISWLDKQFLSLDSFLASLGYYTPSNGLAVTKIDTESLEGYTEISAAVSDPEIAFVTFQLNGAHKYTAEVADGQAVCQIPNTSLVTAEDQLNVVQILAKNSSDDYIISTMEEGNYANAKSNYGVFYSNEEVIQLSQEAEGTDSIGATDKVSLGTDSKANEVSSMETVVQAEAQPGSSYLWIAMLLFGFILLAAGVIVVLKSRKKRRMQ